MICARPAAFRPDPIYRRLRLRGSVEAQPRQKTDAVIGKAKPFRGSKRRSRRLGGEAVQAIADNPRAVQSAALFATKSDAGLREMLSLQMSAGTTRG